MKTLQNKIQSLSVGTKYKISSINSRGQIYRVTENAIQLNCMSVGMAWIPKSQIIDIDELTGEIQISLWFEKKLNEKSHASSGAY
jgi:hypothetical protein